MNVSCWIQGQSRHYKPFVANRVGGLHEYSSLDQWRHVLTKENPSFRVSDELWWSGPRFPQNTEDKWPKRKLSAPDLGEELKSQVRVNRFEKK